MLWTAHNSNSLYLPKRFELSGVNCIIIVVVIITNIIIIDYYYYQYYSHPMGLLLDFYNCSTSKICTLTIKLFFCFNNNLWLTWDQAYFRFALKITFQRARRNEKRAWYKPSTKSLPPTFLIDWHLPNQPTKITSVACFSSMQIFHAWENADWLT